MARISLDPKPTPLTRVGDAYPRRRFGVELEPTRAMGHHRAVLLAYAALERRVARWHRLPPRLTVLAVLGAAQQVGCPWCLDFGHWDAAARGVLDPAELRDLPAWRDSAHFDELDRAVLDYAVAMTGDVATITDEQVEWLRQRLGEPALVELTMMVAVENLRSRFNSALGLASQGFRDRCELPVAR